MSIHTDPTVIEGFEPIRVAEQIDLPRWPGEPSTYQPDPPRPPASTPAPVVARFVVSISVQIEPLEAE